MKRHTLRNTTLLWSGALLALLLPLSAPAFESGSTGADGDFAPGSDTTVTVPADGILNYSTYNVPDGVTVRYLRNAGNTPVFILVQGDAVIDGVIDISGLDGDRLGDSPPGGFDGGQPHPNGSAYGAGPGGGAGGDNASGGAGGSFGSRGRSTGSGHVPGDVYGSELLQPLLGGSGGGSTFTASSTLEAYRGGGGAGALMIAASGTLTLNGEIAATGGDGAPQDATANIPGAGAGSGGGVRLIATTLAGTGVIDVSGGTGGLGLNGTSTRNGGDGGAGRVRLEADLLDFGGTVVPNVVTTSDPRTVFLADMPQIRITSIAGVSVPANPTGEGDVSLPADTANPVTVAFEANHVTVGSTVELTVKHAWRGLRTATSDPLSGTEASSTASADVNLEEGPSVLTASVTFAPPPGLAEALSPFADGRKIAAVSIESTLGNGESRVTVTTEDGDVIEVPRGAVRL